MPTVLPPDDLRPRLIVAVHSYAHPSIAARCLIPEGHPMRILSLSLPFITVSSLQRHGGWSPPIIFDTRHASLTRLSSSYVNSLRATSHSPSPSPSSTYSRRLLGGLAPHPTTSPDSSPW